MRRLAFLCLTLTLACSRETPAPEPAATATTSTTTTNTATQPPVVTMTSLPEMNKGTYDEALLWFRSNNGFDFVLDDQGVHAEGKVMRERIGRERVQFRANGDEWLAEATAKGVTWKRRAGNAWKDVAMPEFGARIYQRVTLPFDPQKKEGVALRVSEEGPSNLYRFTNANTGDVHELWVRKTDGAVERMKIGDKVELRIGG
jgi:hypothetical protein